MRGPKLIQILCDYRNLLRADGMSYGDYARLRGNKFPHLIYLLFGFGRFATRPLRGPESSPKQLVARFKMADERSWPPYKPI